MASIRSPADVITEKLTHYLGPHTARVAVKSFAERELGRHPEAVTAADVPALLEALRPMLKTMIGLQRAETLLSDLARELSQ